MMAVRSILTLCVMFAATGCHRRSRLPATSILIQASPSEVGMDTRLPATLDSIAAAGIRAEAAPGLAIAVARYGRVVYLRGHGAIDWPAGADAVTDSTIYDLASLTKVVATASAAMMLEEAGLLDVDRPVHEYLPELEAKDKASITVHMLLTHSAGFEAGAPLYTKWRGRAEYLKEINARRLVYRPGTETLYSDWDMVLLQAIVERITGQPLDVFVGERVFSKLGMRDTRFRPDTASMSLRRRIAPTSIDPTRGGLLRGVVNDQNAWALGGVAGHAGLFSSARDLAVFAQMLLNGGEYGVARVIRPETIARWTARQSIGASRALVWDTPAPDASAGHYFSPRSFGHTGYTGTSLWVDPERGVFVVLLMNRINSRGANEKHLALRRAISDAVQRAILDAPLVDWERMLHKT